MGESEYDNVYNEFTYALNRQQELFLKKEEIEDRCQMVLGPYIVGLVILGMLHNLNWLWGLLVVLLNYWNRTSLIRKELRDVRKKANELEGTLSRMREQL